MDPGLFACMTLARIQGFLGLQILFFFLSDLKDDNLLMVNLSRKERKRRFSELTFSCIEDKLLQLCHTGRQKGLDYFPVWLFESVTLVGGQ